MTQWTKQGNAQVAELPAELRVLELDLQFEQGAGRGMMGRLANKLAPADPDLWCIVFCEGVPVDRAEPKSRQRILDGAVHHLGDGRGSGVETVVVDLNRIGEADSDIDGFAFVASCPTGFSRIEGATVRIYDATQQPRAHVANVRFDITGNHTSALLGVLRRGTTGWTFRKEPVYGHAGTDWQQLASLATSQMR